MKPSIDEQIEAVEDSISYAIKGSYARQNLEAALSTLRWLKANPEIAKLVYSITKEFPGARVKQREEE